MMPDVGAVAAKSLTADFGMDTISLAGPLATKLAVMKAAGFTQVMLAARDLVGHPDGWHAAVQEVRASGLRVTGFQVLRDFEGLSGEQGTSNLHDYKVDIARAMLDMCSALQSPLLLVCSTTSKHASADEAVMARDLHKLAMMALPRNIRVAYEGLSWGRYINDCEGAWRVVQLANAPNLGLGIDSYHSFAMNTPPEALRRIDPAKIYLVQLSDFMWQSVSSVEERIDTARHFRVFPGEGAHGDQLSAWIAELGYMGYKGDYSFEVFNDDYTQLPPPVVAKRALKSAQWLAHEVLGRKQGNPGAWVRGVCSELP